MWVSVSWNLIMNMIEIVLIHKHDTGGKQPSHYHINMINAKNGTLTCYFNQLCFFNHFLYPNWLWFSQLECVLLVKFSGLASLLDIALNVIWATLCHHTRQLYIMFQFNKVINDRHQHKNDIHCAQLVNIDCMTVYQLWSWQWLAQMLNGVTVDIVVSDFSTCHLLRVRSSPGRNVLLHTTLLVLEEQSVAGFTGPHGI